MALNVYITVSIVEHVLFVFPNFKGYTPTPGDLILTYNLKEWSRLAGPDPVGSWIFASDPDKKKSLLPYSKCTLKRDICKSFLDEICWKPFSVTFNNFIYGSIQLKADNFGRKWKWLPQNFMKFGTLAGLCEKLKNPKYYISVTSGYRGHSVS